jgi:putative ABC transport system permease protein
VVRTTGDPAALAPTARRIVSDLDPTIPPNFNTFSQVFASSLDARRFNVTLVAAFALTALLLAVAGIYGVMAYSVVRRTREIGVRIALGASARNILGLILQQGMLTAVIGLALGTAGSLALTRLMKSLLFQVSANDPLTLTAVALLLVAVALVASYIPARRATRVDPNIALRYE